MIRYSRFGFNNDTSIKNQEKISITIQYEDKEFQKQFDINTNCSNIIEEFLKEGIISRNKNYYLFYPESIFNCFFIINCYFKLENITLSDETVLSSIIKINEKVTKIIILKYFQKIILAPTTIKS